MIVISFLGNILGKAMTFIFNIVGDYGLSIIIFTFLTKILLFPLNMVTQKNSINMVRLMPEENALKIKYIDDKDKLGEEQLKLYKKYHYHPLLSSVPLLIQIPLVLGLVYVMYHPLTFILQFDAGVISSFKDWLGTFADPDKLAENTYQLEIVSLIKSALIPEGHALPDMLLAPAEQIKELNMMFLGIDLSKTPSFKHDYVLLLIPLISGLSAWLMCVIQNKINVLQVSQGSLNKILTTLFMIAFSTYFAFLVPAGVGLYWIFGNLFAIPFMYLYNICMPPKKYIDYEYLKKMNEQRIEKEKLHKKYNAREKEDYKKFFAVQDMKLMFYSESNGFYKYFKGTIDYICEHSDLDIHYVTSDPNDKIFEDPRPQIHPYYIGSDRRLVPLFMKLECTMVVMTMPDLEKYHIKRSRVKKDIEYVYMYHGIGSNCTLRKGALDWFDTILVPNVDHTQEIRAEEELYNLPKKRLVETGYTLIDDMCRTYNSTEHKPNEIPKILIAPSWQVDNIIDLCVDDLLAELGKTDYEIILRPHPQHVKHEPEKFETLKEKFKDKKNITVQTDFSSNNPVMEADVLITDWSDICWEYAFVTKRPVLFIDTPMKMMNQEYYKLGIEPINDKLRTEIGAIVKPTELGKTNDIIADMLAKREEYAEKIQKVYEEHVYNIGKSDKLSGRYIIKRLTGK